jgi:ubiquinone/menaquinone biosynthesis C-methylase UbiE
MFMAFLDLALSVSSRATRSLMSNERIREVYYRMWNRRGFGGFYQHERMLADKVRMDTYFRAIDRHIAEGEQVVDVGTGTGILSLFAAGKRPRRVYALDHSSKMIEYAKSVAAFNECHAITFVEGHSSSFSPDEPVDAIIHEQMGDLLFQERMIQTLLDVRDRTLKKGGRILPGKFEFFLEPVQLHPDKRIPLVHEIEVHGIAYPPMPEEASPSYLLRYIDPSEVQFELCEPEPVFTVDLMTLTLDAVPRRFTVKKPIRRAGELGGVCSYFRAIFDEEISFGTGPGDPRTSWAMPLLRTPKRTYATGETFEMSIEVPQLSEFKTWHWTLDA